MRRKNFQKLAHRIYAGWKFLLSFRKSDWTIEDYPISIHRQTKQFTDLPPDLRVFVVVAEVIHWPMLFGGGTSRTEAMEDLQKNFLKRKSSMSMLPRPGTKVPVESASRIRIDRHAELAREFTRSVLQLPWAFLSDESSLSDFSSQDTKSELVSKIRERYGVDVSDIGSGNLADILERIASSRNPQSQQN